MTTQKFKVLGYMTTQHLILISTSANSYTPIQHKNMAEFCMHTELVQQVILDTILIGGSRQYAQGNQYTQINRLPHLIHLCVCVCGVCV